MDAALGTEPVPAGDPSVEALRVRFSHPAAETVMTTAAKSRHITARCMVRTT
jgi:hypothetical protein